MPVKFTPLLETITKNLREMCTELGDKFESWYEFVYSYNSSYVHSDYFSIEGLFEEEFGTRTVNIGPMEFEALEIFMRVLEMSGYMLIEICRITNINSEEVEQEWQNSIKLTLEEAKEKNL